MASPPVRSAELHIRSWRRDLGAWLMAVAAVFLQQNFTGMVGKPLTVPVPSGPTGSGSSSRDNAGRHGEATCRPTLVVMFAHRDVDRHEWLSSEFGFPPAWERCGEYRTFSEVTSG